MTPEQALEMLRQQLDSPDYKAWKGQHVQNQQALDVLDGAILRTQSQPKKPAGKRPNQPRKAV